MAVHALHSAVPQVEPLKPSSRRGLLLLVAVAHVAAAALVLRAAPPVAQRSAGRPIVVDFVTLRAPAAVRPPAPAQPRVPAPRQVVAVTARQEPAPADFTAPVPDPTPAEAIVTPEAPAPIPAASLPAVASPPAPRTVAITSVEYLVEPVLDYPLASRRLREQGEVHVRVLVDARGRPERLQLQRSSGHARLDESALETVRATRFRPYTEDGIPQPFWVVMPLVFELEQ